MCWAQRNTQHKNATKYHRYEWRGGAIMVIAVPHTAYVPFIEKRCFLVLLVALALALSFRKDIAANI